MDHWGAGNKRPLGYASPSTHPLSLLPTHFRPVPPAALPACCSHLPVKLELLEIHMERGEAWLDLKGVRERHQPAARAVVYGEHGQHPHFRQLSFHWASFTTERARLRLRSNDQAMMLAAGLQQLSSLKSLVVEDGRPLGESTQSLLLPGLGALPNLVRLECIGAIPAEAWSCSRLTDLFLKSTQLPETPAVVLLQRLHHLKLESCDCAGSHAMPDAWCAQLSGLRRLQIHVPTHLRLCKLPLSFTQLRCAGLAERAGRLSVLRGPTALCACHCSCGAAWLSRNPPA